MREIKFRGKRIDNKEWIYGDLIKHSIISPFTYIAKGTGYKVDDFEIGIPIKVFPATVGQFTGQKDKYGKEIWQGDILMGKGFEGEVVWNNELSLFEVTVLIGEGEYGTMTIYSKQENGNNINREIIGNIHD